MDRLEELRGELRNEFGQVKESTVSKRGIIRNIGHLDCDELEGRSKKRGKYKVQSNETLLQ